jgi:hypothetical protein
LALAGPEKLAGGKSAQADAATGTTAITDLSAPAGGAGKSETAHLAQSALPVLLSLAIILPHCEL